MIAKGGWHKLPFLQGNLPEGGRWAALLLYGVTFN
jgi:hypothetical protein